MNSGAPATVQKTKKNRLIVKIEYQYGGDDQGSIGQGIRDISRLPLLVVGHVQATWRVPGTNLSNKIYLFNFLSGSRTDGYM